MKSELTLTPRVKIVRALWPPRLALVAEMMITAKPELDVSGPGEFLLDLHKRASAQSKKLSRVQINDCTPSYGFVERSLRCLRNYAEDELQLADQFPDDGSVDDAVEITDDAEYRHFDSMIFEAPELLALSVVTGRTIWVDADGMYGNARYSMCAYVRTDTIMLSHHFGSQEWSISTRGKQLRLHAQLFGTKTVRPTPGEIAAAGSNVGLAVEDLSDLAGLGSSDAAYAAAAAAEVVMVSVGGLVDLALAGAKSAEPYVYVLLSAPCTRVPRSGSALVHSEMHTVLVRFDSEEQLRAEDLSGFAFGSFKSGLPDGWLVGGGALAIAKYVVAQEAKALGYVVYDPKLRG